MQRKYSEVVNFVPNFPNTEYRQRSREPPNNQKLSPIMGINSNNNPNICMHPQFQPLIKQDHFPRETLRIPSSSFQVGDRSTPNFNVNVNLVQTLESPLLDPRRLTTNGFKPTGLTPQPLANRRVDHFNVSSDQPQQFNSPQNFGSPRTINYSPMPDSLNKNLYGVHTSPIKLEQYQTQPKQFSSPMSNPPQLPNNPSPVNQNNIRQNGRVYQSMIIPDVSTEKPQENRQLFSGLNQQYHVITSNPNISDLESTFNSDVHPSSNELQIPGSGRKIPKYEETRKKEEVWKSAELKIKPQQTQNTSNLKFSSIFSFNGESIKEKDGSSTKNLRDKRTSLRLEDVGRFVASSQKKENFTPELSPSEFQFRKKNEPSISLKEVENVEEMRNFTIDDFETIEKLGRGTYGEVFLVRERKSKFVCVLKSLSKKKIKELNLEEHVFREIKIQSYLNHKHITTLYGVFHDENKIYLIMECMTDGSMASNGKKKISESEVAHLVQQVCEGLLYMHREDIIHRDIKPENLLLNNNYLKIGDFGCAVFGNTLRRTVVGCYAYISPEQFSNNPYDQKIDSWSVGILAYEMLTGRPPYEEQLRKVAMEATKEDRSMNTASMMDFPEIEFPSDTSISPDAIDFIRRLLDKDPIKRAELKEALKHKFLGKAKEYEKYLESKL